MEANFSRTLLALCTLGAPSVAFAYPGSAMVTVHNDTPATVTTTVDGIRVQLAAGQTRSIAIPAGSSTLVATYEQFGRVTTLRTEAFFLRSGRSTYVELDAPLTTRVLLTNESERGGTVLINGRQAESLGPHESELVTVPVGMAQLAFLVDGRQVDSQRMQLLPMVEQRWSMDLPRTGDLVVYNPLPIPVVLTCDRGLKRTVAAFGQTRYDDLALGSFHLRATRVTGEAVDDLRASIQPMTDARVTVDAPTTGLVAIDNDTSTPVDVYERGRRIASYAPGAEARLLLTVGWHELEVRDAYGRRVEDTWIEVEPYDVAKLEVDARRHEQAYRGHDREREDDDEEREVASAHCSM